MKKTYTRPKVYICIVPRTNIVCESMQIDSNRSSDDSYKSRGRDGGWDSDIEW